MKKYRYTLLMCKVIDVFADDLDEATDRAMTDPTKREDFVVLEHQRMIETPKEKETPYRNN